MDKGLFLSEEVLREVLLGERMRLGAKAAVYWLSLHLEDPGYTGTQETNEFTYGGYSRVGLKRGEAWRVADGRGVLAVDARFPLCVSGGGFVRYGALGLAREGAGEILYRLRVREGFNIAPGDKPVVPAGSIEIVEN